MADRKRGAPVPDLESLFATLDGRSGSALARFRITRGGRPSLWLAAAIAGAAAWLPLLVLAAIEGVALGDRVGVPLLKDFLPYGQFLIAVPLLIFTELPIGKRIGWAMAELRRSDVLAPDDTPALERILVRAVQLWRGRSVNIAILIATLAVIVVSFWGAREWLTGGWQYVDERMTLSGWWYLLVSLPVMRFLALRWLWRLIVWVWVLWKVARLKLKLQPTHPDRSGGIAFLGGAQASFSWLVMALGIQLSCLAADAVHYGGADLLSFKMQLVAFVLIGLVILLLPLLLFTPKLVYEREEMLIYLTGKGYDGTVRLDAMLRAASAGEWPNEDISGMADFMPLYENAKLMRPVPLELRHVLIVILAAVVPFVPLVFLVMPAQEVFQAVVKLLI